MKYLSYVARLLFRKPWISLQGSVIRTLAPKMVQRDLFFKGSWLLFTIRLLL